jgi:dinuclear metal center YbgI/SA1388 family protein
LTKVTDILEWADELLQADSFPDFGPNGLQLPGAEDAEMIATAVSANLETLDRAREAGADLILVHHGLCWDGAPRAVSRPLAARLKTLLEGNVALAAYHLPLDAHIAIGNNALIADGLGCDVWERFADVGLTARFPDDGIPAAELFERVHRLTEREPLVFDAGPDPVRTIGIVSGAASGLLDDAVAAGLDAFLTGEPKEQVMGTAREGGVHFIAAGHYATETFGIRRLGELAAERFGLRHVFVDVPNPV